MIILYSEISTNKKKYIKYNDLLVYNKFIEIKKDMKINENLKLWKLIELLTLMTMTVKFIKMVNGEKYIQNYLHDIDIVCVSEFIDRYRQNLVVFAYH